MFTRIRAAASGLFAFAGLALASPAIFPTADAGAPPTPSMRETLLYDFVNLTEIAQWRNQDDPVMGGVSRSRAIAGPPSTMVFTGVVSLDNNGGFAAVRSFGMPKPVDLSDDDALRIRVLGDGKVYGFTLSTASTQPLLYQTRFQTQPGEWLTVDMPFRDFVPTRFGFRPPGAPDLNPRDIQLFGFIIADKQVGPFELSVDWIKAVRR